MNTITELHDVPCPMRDGVNLTTDILMPTDGGPFPTVLIRLPYDRGSDMSFCLGTAMHLSNADMRSLFKTQEEDMILMVNGTHSSVSQMMATIQ